MPTHTAPHIKWLLTERAALAGAVPALSSHIAGLQLQLQGIEQQLAAAQSKLARAQQRIAALDSSIRLFDESIDPEVVSPVRAWAGRYGKRGGRKAFLLDLLRQAYPQSISATDLGKAVIERFALDRNPAFDRRQYLWGTFKGQLNRLLAEGLVTRTVVKREGSSCKNYWAWKKR